MEDTANTIAEVKRRLKEEESKEEKQELKQEAKEVKEEPKAEEKKPKKSKKDEEKYTEELMTIPLTRAWNSPPKKRTIKALQIIKKHVQRRFKNKSVKIGTELNVKIWARGIEKPPRKIRIKNRIYEKEVKVFPA